MRQKIFAAFIFFIVPLNLLSITLGVPALDREFQSAVQIWTIEKNKPEYLCSGVIIAPDTVITTASCVYNKDDILRTNTLFVTTDKNMSYQVPLANALQNVASIAKKGIRNREQDIIVIFLNQPLSAEPAILLSKNESAQIRSINQTYLVGYGSKAKFEHTHSLSDWWEGFWSSTPSVSTGDRTIAKTHVSSISETEIQLTEAPSDGYACHGDEGSPLYAHIDTPFSNSQRLIGIVVTSDPLKNCERPTRILRLDALRDFFEEKMVHECQAGNRISCEVPGLLAPGYNEIQVREKPKSNDEIKSPPEEINNAEPEKPKEAQEIPQNLTPETPTDSTPERSKQKRAKNRRLSATAEGVGCSCQQVFTTPN